MSNPPPIPTCPQCGTPLATPDTLCRACLLKRGLEPNTLPNTEIPNQKSIAWTPPSLTQLAPFFPDLDLLSLLGRGGMGAVYKARQKSLDRIIALKILPPQLSSDPTFPARFTHEAQALAKLNHPHIVTIYDFGQREFPVSSVEFQQPVASTLETRNLKLETIFFLSMEFIDGLSLRQLLDTSPIDPNTALAIVPQICDALQYAHDRGIVHRDIKPENILLTKSGQIKIADFGLATIISPSQSSALSTQSSVLSTSIAGTPAYMAPEQSASPNSVDHRADLYALGVVFYQMLTGELPTDKFQPPSKIPGLHIDVRLDQIVLRALEKSPDLRFQNATQFKTEVQTVITTPSSGNTSAPAPSSSEISNLKSPSVSRDAIIRSLRLPSLLLRITSLINLVILLLYTLMILTLPAITPLPGNARVVLLSIAAIIFILVANLFIIRAANNMAKLKNYSQAFAACILPVILFPAYFIFTCFLLPLFIVSLIAAIWSLTLLSRTEIRAAFDAPTPSAPPPPSEISNFKSPQSSPLEYRSPATLFGLPLLHITAGIDPLTKKTRIAHGIIAIGPIARGFLAIGGIAQGFIALGGLSLGIVSLGALSLGILACGGLSLGLFSLSSGISIAAFYASGGLAIAPNAHGGLAFGQRLFAGLPFHLPRTFSLILAAATFLFVTAALLGAFFAPAPSRTPSTPNRPSGYSKLFVAAMIFACFLFAAVAVTSVFLFSNLMSIASSPQPIITLHYRVFIAPAQLVDQLIPPQSRQSAEQNLSDNTSPKSASANSPYTASSQTAQIPSALLNPLLPEPDISSSTNLSTTPSPGLLAERTYTIDYWPRSSANWTYSRADQLFQGGGSGNGFLGVRQATATGLPTYTQLRAEYLITHDLDVHSPLHIPLRARITWQGHVPPADTTRLFLIPFTQNDGSPKYLLFAIESVPTTNATLFPPRNPVKTLPTGITVPVNLNPSLESQLNLQAAETALKRAQAQYNIGRISPLDLHRAQANRDLAAAALVDDSAEIARIKFRIADEELKIAQTYFRIGRINSSDLQTAQQTRDLAAAATQPTIPTDIPTLPPDNIAPIPSTLPANPIIPQAKPFIDALQAIRASNVQAYRNVFIRSLREADQDWNQKLADAAIALKKSLGNTPLNQFTFSYQGDDSTGTLTLHWPTEPPSADPFEISVVKEETEWKIAED